jgi:heme/copper-type cytochrome/quinol oxidase subunit 1
MRWLRKVGAFLLASLMLLLGVAPLARATSAFDPLVAAVSFTDATTAIFAVAAVLVGVSVVIAGIMIVWRMVKRSRSA